MALPVNGSTHLIPAYYSFIDPNRMKGWVGLVGWPVTDGLPTLVVTHQLQVERKHVRLSCEITIKLLIYSLKHMGPRTDGLKYQLAVCHINTKIDQKEHSRTDTKRKSLNIFFRLVKRLYKHYINHNWTLFTLTFRSLSEIFVRRSCSILVWFYPQHAEL